MRTGMIAGVVLLLAACLSAPVHGCSLTSGNVSVYINFTNGGGGACPVQYFTPAEGWENITYTDKGTTKVKLMKCEPDERQNLASLDLRKDAESLIETNQGRVDQSERIKIAEYDAAKAIGKYRENTWYSLEARIGSDYLVVVTTWDESDYNDALNMTIYDDSGVA